MRELYKLFFDHSNDMKYLFNGNAWQGLKMISDQYIKTRQEFQSLTDPNHIPVWLNTNQHRLFNVPLIQCEKDRKPTKFDRFEFVSFKEEQNLNSCFYFGNSSIEDDVAGHGYSGDVRIYIPYKTLRYDDTAVRWALASMGIYTFEMVYGSNDQGRYLDAGFEMLQRDWPFKVDFTDWSLNVKTRTPGFDGLTDEEYDMLSEDEKDDIDLKERLWEIEEGYHDDEDDRI